MLNPEFLEIMDRLKSANLPTYSLVMDDLFLDTWYKIFQHTDVRLFKKAIFRIMTTEKQYPSIAVVREYLETEVNKNREKMKGIEYKPKPDPQAVLKINKIISESLDRMNLKKKVEAKPEKAKILYKDTQ
jgi:hypothetical protein